MSDAAHTFDIPVGDDGRLVVPADELARHGVHAGDTVRIQAVRKSRRRSLLGFRDSGLDYTQEHLEELRREMGEGLGEDLTR